jgi:hypothetical protein
MQTLGGPNVTQIFVHDVTSLPNWKEIAAISPGFEEYEERALVFARPHDLVCVSGEVDDQHLAFLSSLGVGSRYDNVVQAWTEDHSRSGDILPDLLMSNHEALSGMGKLLRGRHEIFLNPLIGSSRQFDLARNIETVTGKQLGMLGGPPEIVDYAYTKHNARAKALELGVPVAGGETVRLQLGVDGRPLDITPMEVAINQHIPVTGKVIIRGSYGAAGCATVIVEDSPESIQAALHKITQRSDNGIYLVEVMLDVRVSPNIMMYIEPNSDYVLCVSVTDQRLSDALVHKGKCREDKGNGGVGTEDVKMAESARISWIGGFRLWGISESRKGRVAALSGRSQSKNECSSLPQSSHGATQYETGTERWTVH